MVKVGNRNRRFNVKSTSGPQYQFSQVPKAEIPRSQFRRSHGHKTTFNEGDLVPIYVDEVLPGDTFNVRLSVFARLSTPLVPLMDNVFLDLFFFFVPLRLLWTNFQKFMGEQVNPGDSTSYNTPIVTVPGGGFAALSLWDYFGLPVAKDMSVGPVAFHSRAYNLIWNEWFRDENLQNSVTVDKGDGPDTASSYVLKKRGKRHDYFTSCLPWPQKGLGVNLPLGTSAPVSVGTFTVVPQTSGQVQPRFVNPSGAANPLEVNGTGLNTPVLLDVTSGSLGPLQFYDSGLKLSGAGVADLTAATAATINQLRQAFQLQRLQERDARGGTRYREILLSHFGVVSPDARLQRPEYLGGGSVNMSTQEVAQTSATGLTGGSRPLGALGAVAKFGGSGAGFVKSFVEHGVLLGLASVRGDVSYQQGVHKMFRRRTRFDFYWPALAHIGEQAVLNEEIYYNNDSNDGLVFGYQERWAEYRYKPSVITGQFRSTHGTPLDMYHLAQKFTTLPVLGDTFIQESPPLSRVVATPSEPRVILDSFFEVQTARPMPVYSVPGKIDHF